MSDYVMSVGCDVPKDTIIVAVAKPGRAGLEGCSTFANRRSALRRMIDRLVSKGETLSFCYEAGPCGYGVYRKITDLGHHGDVVAPGLVLRGATERVKIDQRDALKRARLHRADELTPVGVPDPEHEAIRDLTCAREEMNAFHTKARQGLSAFLLRQDRVYLRKSRWT